MARKRKRIVTPEERDALALADLVRQLDELDALRAQMAEKDSDKTLR